MKNCARNCTPPRKGTAIRHSTRFWRHWTRKRQRSSIRTMSSGWYGQSRSARRRDTPKQKSTGCSVLPTVPTANADSCSPITTARYCMTGSIGAWIRCSLRDYWRRLSGYWGSPEIQSRHRPRCRQSDIRNSSPISAANAAYLRQRTPFGNRHAIMPSGK